MVLLLYVFQAQDTELPLARERQDKQDRHEKKMKHQPTNPKILLHLSLPQKRFFVCADNHDTGTQMGVQYI